MAEYKYDHIVVGAGISGLTTALLLARQGRRVLIVEKAPAIGGSMVRFPIAGIPFETGFHFTGGLQSGGLLSDMLKVLEVEERIKPRPFDADEGMRFVFESSGHRYHFPCLRAGMMEALVAHFPEEAEAISVYFQRVDEICAKTTSMNLRTLKDMSSPLDEDYQSLSSVLDQLFQSVELKSMMAGYCLCYGVGPDEISFANHARICQGMYDSLVTVEGGGDAFVTALQGQLRKYDVDIRCKCTVDAIEELEGKTAGAFRLSNDDLVRFDSAVLTIHPMEILKLLPPEKLRPAFKSRVGAYEASSGFFAVFGTCDLPELLNDFILLGLPDPDLNKVFAVGDREADSMLFGICGEENGTRTLTILEAARPEEYAEWADSSLQKRPDSYYEFKKRKTDRIVERLHELMPELKGHFQPLESSTPLTFRDYLNSPDGSAYGIKQLMGQFNLLGKLPIRNLYAAGQSSVLPGIMGAMASAFIIARSLADTEEFDRHIDERLDA
ncbi:NAD(P)/FAD-dependent oxidoreductase [Pontiellaceae bacterium B12227]|nr:NAD(P)/FAD-dependent oxidoreductase [Pontiellaceae bacterium B12227]